MIFVFDQIDKNCQIRHVLNLRAPEASRFRDKKDTLSDDIFEGAKDTGPDILEAMGTLEDQQDQIVKR